MENQSKYQQLFNSVPCGILQIAMPFAEMCTLISCNSRAAQILNLSAEQIEERSLWVPDYMDKHNRRNAAKIFNKLVNPGEKSTFLLQLYSGTVQGEAEIIETEAGSVLQFIFLEIGNEIAARRREAEQAELLESVLQSVQCGVLRFGFVEDEERIILVNRKGWELLDFGNEAECKALGLNGFMPKVHQEDRKKLLSMHYGITGAAGKNACEFRLTDRDGKLRWISAEEQKLRDVHGEDIIQMTLSDITGQKQLMDRKDAENNEIISSLGNMYFLILYVDVKSDSYKVIKSSNSSVFGVSSRPYSEELHREIIRAQSGKPDSAVDVYEDSMSLSAFSKRFAEGLTLWESDFIFSNDPAAKYYRVETVMSGENKELNHIIMALRDVTELRTKELQERQALQSAYEAAEQANRAKTDFLSRMSHDIRTPMNAIVGLTQIMQRHLDDPEKLQDYIDKIDDSSALLLELINEVLDMSRVESGKLVLDKQPVDMQSLSDKINIVIQPEIQRYHHNLKLENTLGRKLFLADGLRIQQIVLNILSNCVKFTPEGGHIGWKLWEEPGTAGKYSNIHMLISDDGVGMSEEFLKKIYQPFEREEQSGTGKVQGTGLGMTIVQNLVQLMNGWIEIQSAPGKGSKFHIMLPLIPEAEPEKPAADIALNSEKPELSGKHILLTEDNNINMIIAGELLRDTGALVEQAGNGREALELFKSRGEGYYDLIFMDIRMPIMDGYEATRQIRAVKRADAANIPIIAMTANAFAEDVQKALAAGMNEHISKPVQIGLLYSLLQKWLGKKGAQDEAK